MFEISGKIALITGGASGVGLMYTKELLRRGLKGVTIADINEDLGKKALEQIIDEFGENKAIFVKVDVSDKTQFEGAFKKTIEQFNNLDILFNNAGILDDRIWETEISINVNGTIHGTLLAIQNYISKYKSDSEGLIVNVSSGTGIVPVEMFPIYAATKHAVIGFSRSVGTKFHYNLSKVRVITICPGLTNTPLLKNCEEKCLFPEFVEPYQKLKPSLNMQSPEVFAKDVVNLLKDAPNGSVWLGCDNQKPYQLKFIIEELHLK